MKNYDFGRDAKTVDRGRESCTGAEKGGWKAGRRFFLIIPHGFLVLLLAGTVMASCLNPVGFMPDLKSFPGSAVGQDKPGDQDAQKPGNVSPPDTPILHPESDRGVIVFKNLSGGAKGLSAVFTISGQKSGISASLPLGPGQEKSITLFPDTYYVAITFEGQGSPITGSKVLLPGRVEYAYFYVDKNGNYKGGINTDSSFVYGDINYSYYADNENNGDNRDSNNVAKPEEGDVSLENNPRNKLPANMRENYGLVLIHNISNTMPLLKLTFDHALPDKTAVHWEMNPGPDKGTQKSIVLRPGAWQVRSIWIDPADPNCAGGLITTDVKKVGASGYINHLYFYKAVDGKWYLTDKEDSRQWSPPVENKDYNSGGVGQDNQSTVSLAGEGQYTNENGVINTNHAWWDTNDGRNNFGILAVKNLSSRSRITKVGLEYASDSKRKYEMGPIGARNDMSVILGKGDWKITVHYTTGGISYTKTLTKNVQALGLTNRLNFAYFYYTNKSGYNVSADQSPPDYDNDAGGSTNPGEKEGDSPGALTDGNRGTLGLLILKNLSSDTNVDIARAAANFTAVPLSYTMNPGPNSKDQKSILLQAGEWSASASYYPVNAQTAVSTPSKNIQIAPGQVSYMYFYKNRGGAFELSLSWPPVPNNAAPENADPGTIISENEGWLRIINKSMVSTIDRVQYNNGGAWIDIAIPSASIAPGYTSDPDLVVLKGSWSFRFKIATKPTYSQAVSKTVKAGETAALEYSDALDSDLPPAGFGTLRIVNNSPHMIVKLVTQTRNSAGVYESKTQAIPTINPKGQSGSTQIQVLSAGGAGQSRDYIVQCYTDDNTFYEETALIRDGRITSVIVKDTSSQVVVDQHNPDPNLTHGGLLVINKYSGPLSFKIFRIFLYKKLPNNSYGDNYVAPDSGLYQKDYPGIPAASAQVFNGTVYNKDDYLLAGQSRNFASLEQGTYRLFIFAGSYNWDYYEDNNMVGSIPM
ncbi:MAG: hypothetical protein LBQ46_13185, partial [Treponema sp.]|nr:hypothetical protein [Treponema sp.]